MAFNLQALRQNPATITYFLRLSYRLSPKWSVLNLLLSFTRGLVPLLFIFAVKIFLDVATEASQAASPNIWRIGGYIAGLIFPLFLLRVMQEVWQPYVSEKLATQVSAYMYNRMHEQSLRLPVRFFDDNAYRNLFHRVSRETSFRPLRLVKNTGVIAQSMLALLIIAGVLLWFYPFIMILLVLLFIPGLILQMRFAVKRHALSKQQTEQERRMSYYSQVLTGEAFARELRLFGLGKTFKKRFNRAQEQRDSEKLHLHRQVGKRETLVQMGFALLISGLIAFISLQAIDGQIGTSQMVLLILAVHRSIIFFQGLKQGISQLTEDGKYLQDFLDFQNLPSSQEKPATPPRRSTSPPSIAFKRVTFRYPGASSPILQDVTFRIEAGETVILAGANGSGKSTLIQLLLRFYDPQEGTILLNEVDIRQIPLQELRQKLSVLFQQYVLYNESLRDNIWFGNTNKPRAGKALQYAAAFSGIHKVASGLPGGYDALLGNLFRHSHELSVGEWQKTAIARTVFRNAPVAIFDEPNSALDGEAERRFFRQVSEHISARTAILALHRLTAFHKQSRLLVLENGRLAEEGYFDTLMQRRGTLWRLYGE